MWNKKKNNKNGNNFLKKRFEIYIFSLLEHGLVLLKVYIISFSLSPSLSLET